MGGVHDHGIDRGSHPFDMSTHQLVQRRALSGHPIAIDQFLVSWHFVVCSDVYLAAEYPIVATARPEQGVVLQYWTFGS